MPLYQMKRVPEDGKVSASGLSCSVSAFRLGAWSFAGGSVLLPGDGAWFVGVEFWSSQLRVLPRLGHRGWVPVARVVASGGAITSVENIEPVMPECRIPRTMRKLHAGQPLSVVVMGSSLTSSGGAATDWPGMVFGAGATNRYRLPGTVSCQYRGIGASPNQYQLAQLGVASGHTSYGFPDSGFSRALTNKFAPNGRSAMFNGVDLVVIGLLANGGDYRLEAIEPVIRKLRQRGVEVIVVTDNPQGPSTDYAAMTSAGLYVDGPTVMQIADLYGVELADTAAYVASAHIRTGGVGIYGDAIHMATGLPVGPAAVLPANGHEAWARAVRSIFSVGVTVSPETSAAASYDFTTGEQGWQLWAAGGSVQASGGALVATKAVASASQWGFRLQLANSPAAGPLAAGDTVRIQCAIALGAGVSAVQFGLTSGAWSGNVQTATASGTVDFLVSASGASTDITLLAIPDNAPVGSTITIDNVTITVTRQGSVSTFNVVPDRRLVSAPLPPVRVVTDMKTPADAFIILPADELALGNNDAAKGTLGASPFGASSFARCFSSAVGASQDLLSVGVGQKLFLGGDAAVAVALVHYREPADGACTFDVKINGAVNKTMTIAAVPFANEWYLPIYTPSQFNAPGPAAQASIEIAVTSGTLKLAAGVILTADVDYVLPEQITFVGSGWLPKEISRSGLPGRPTDTAGDFAQLRCTGRRVNWILSANPGSRAVHLSSGRATTMNAAVSGNYHVRATASPLGEGENHTITCAASNASGSAADGRALHIGGAIIVNDR
jgi:hypothetical protein